jgi:DNA-binding LacI/PurR family transcriptional regulator
MEFLKDLSLDNKKINIGYLDDNDYGECYSKVMMGVHEAAKKHNVNLIRFSYFTSNDFFKYSNQSEMVLNLMEQSNLDGLIFLGWTEAAAAGNYDNFMYKFGDIPIVSIGTGYESIPCVYFPSDIYVRETIIHLIEVHNSKRIAFIGPDKYDDRNRVYIETMKEYGIYHSELYVDDKELGGLDSVERVKKALNILIDQRGVKFDAIISPGSYETEFLLIDFENRGISVPKDVALISYDDGETGQYTVPALTSIYFPWRELGFYGCEKLIKLITEGQVEHSSPVEGRIIYRDSCGCLSTSANDALVGNICSVDKDLRTLNEIEIKELVHKMDLKFPHSGMNFHNLLKCFFLDFNNYTYNFFLNELTNQLSNATIISNYSNTQDIISFLRRFLMSYTISTPEALQWFGNIFQKSQVLLLENISEKRGNIEVSIKYTSQILQEISQRLITNFTLENITTSLEINLPKLKIPSCYMILFDSVDTTNDSGDKFDNCKLVFNYENNHRREIRNTRTESAYEIIRDIQTKENAPQTMFAHYLHVSDYYMGYILFEAGPINEGVYQALAVHLSTALMGSYMLEELEKSYDKLITQAYREGMADIVISMLHNIGNVFNSVNSSIQIAKDAIALSPIDDILKANKLLERNMDSLDNFFINDSRGKKLLQFYIMLGKAYKEHKERLVYHIERINDKTSYINEIISAQQSYAGVSMAIEEMELVNIIEDILKVKSVVLDKDNIDIMRQYESFPLVMASRSKLFHIIFNMINYAGEKLKDSLSNDRKLTIKVFEDDKGKYIYIFSNGDNSYIEEINKIFEGQFTAVEEGSELSLYSCAKYIKEIGGCIRVEAGNLGEGILYKLIFT